MRTWTLGFLVMGAALAEAPASARPGAQITVQEAVARYTRGDFDAAIVAFDTRRLTVTQFTKALDAWIATGDPVSRPHRRRVAAAFAVDASWHATRHFINLRHANTDPWKRYPPVHADRDTLENYSSQPLVAEWAVAQLPATGKPHESDVLIWRTAVGLAQDGHAWHHLQTRILPAALGRYPDDPRLKLASIVTRTNVDLGSMRGTETDLRHDVLRVERLRTGVPARIPKAIEAFESLLADPSLAGEAALRIGYLELRRGRWPQALARFDAARSTATEPALIAASDYFAGWVLEQEGKPQGAITAYRRAHTITPLMRNLATRLSALLYLHNERADAFAILDPALNARPAPLDFLVVLERADARFVPEWLTAIRKALQ